ncbi:NADP-dependent oxidoreductase [Phenylobacterium montanum]|uniref:NADP-dependent oxidoreductase n=1 Tax=Phenylobacterium montanum TaxID=2823693 RepID=A0A975IWY3_9CAUL|nr:NADP-dependent oxidoreductase [Caulobacter sp. S6]QUD90378.1 NADP-dependent oxidoreductase [Caulobacter sp. S6]
MTAQTHRQWRVAARPIGRPLLASDFEYAEAPIREPDEGEALVKTLYLSFDPAQKSWMENVAGYRDPVQIGDVMPGRGVGVVLESRDGGLRAGDLVEGPIGWRDHAVMPASELKVLPEGVAPPAAMSLLGTTGATAYLGLVHVGKPKPGDALVISGAAGATGSLVGQLGKLAGCRVIGIAGGAEKCAWLTQELGFDGAIDYKSENVRSRLRDLCPKGIDVFWDNVGGEILNDALARLSVGARVVICGGISRYNFDARDPSQMPPGPRNYFNVVFTGATIQGFLLGHYEREIPLAEARLLDWIRKGDLKFKADVREGFEHAPAALMGLFEGGNFGKQMLKVGEP